MRPFWQRAAIERVTPPDNPSPPFAQTDAEAEERFQKHRFVDPLPDADAALLNTADLMDYVALTGMIFPFRVQPEDKWLKPASCAISFAGKILFWTPEGSDTHPTKVERIVKRGEKLVLPKNAIVFLTLEPTFRFPDYIAGRYNLSIRQVYRGLLVGTGPLVDPGFVGRLSVPVHNLTGTDYELTAGDPVVWMEFTKLSRNTRWDPSARATSSPYVRFPDRKLEREDIGDYLRAASARPVVSSIPTEIGAAQRAATSAATSVRRVRNYSIGAGLVALLAVAALAVGVVQLGVDINSNVNDEADRGQQQQRLIDRLEDRLADQEAGLRAVRRLRTQR
jgi:deoxycytidine triphosphate deaminase